MSFDQVRYLEAKRTVDDRSINRHVYGSLVASGRARRVVELGAGTGVMAERLLDWGLVDLGTQVVLVDSHEASTQRASERTRALGLNARVATGDALTFTGDPDRPADLLIGCAFLDLVDLGTALPRLASLVRPGGLLWFPLNYDGETTFEPVPEPTLEAQVLDRYHRSMDERPTGGHSRTGRRLPAALRSAGLEVLAAGSSDWVVLAGPDGRYPADEAYFVDCILQLVAAAAGDGPDARGWLAERRSALGRGDLLYVAHQLDVLARRPLS